MKLNSGENNLNASERLQKFIDNIDSYIESKNFTGPKFNEEFKIAEELSIEKLNSLTRDDCFSYAFMLYQYADFIATELNKNKSVIWYCEDSLNKIFADEMFDMPQYTKHEIKIGAILRENELAKKINEWKIIAQSRVDLLQTKEYNSRRKADCLMEKGKRK